MTLRVVDVFEVRLVCDALDSFLKREDLVITRRDHDGPILQALGEVHGSKRDGSGDSACMGAQVDRGESCALDSQKCSLHLGFGPDEHSDLVRLISLGTRLARSQSAIQADSSSSDERTRQERLGTIEDRDRAAALLR